jgi:hypothetical protein
MRSLMAQSNCSGWLLARTSMNLQPQMRRLRVWPGVSPSRGRRVS